MTKLKTKDKIIYETTKLIQETGDFTFKQISENANVNISAINYHFGSKENLITQMIEDKLLYIKNSLYEFYKKDINPDEAEIFIYNILDTLFVFAIENKNIIRFIFSSPSYVDKVTELYLKNFTCDTDFNCIVFNYIKKLNINKNITDLRIHFLLCSSCFFYPLVLNINEKYKDAVYIYNIEDEDFRKQYINKMVKSILSLEEN